MNAFHTPESTMTPEEAEAIVRRHLERTPETPNGPSIAEVAEVLRVQPEEVAGLLAEIRAEGMRKPRRRSNQRERRVWLQSGGLAILIGGFCMFGMRLARVGPFRQYYPSYSSSYTDGAYQAFVDGKSFGTVYFDGHPNMESQSLSKSLEEAIKDRRWQLGQVNEQSDAVVAETRRAVGEGRWDNAPGVRFSTVEIRKGYGINAMRWAMTTAPIYTGDDSLVAEAVAKERSRRVAEAIKEAVKGLPSPPSNPKL